MSLEKKAENLLEAVAGLINAVTAMVTGSEKATTAAAAAPDKKVTKKELDALKKAAKQLAGKVLKELGKEKLGELLGEFDAAKFSDLKADPEVITNFITGAEMLLVNKPEDDDDLLGGGPEETKEYTLEDVKALLLTINNSEALGKDVTRQILAGLGVARLGELKKDKFGDAVNAAQAAIDGAL